MLGAHLRRGNCVVLESTTYPGTTEDLMIPVLEAVGFRQVEVFGPHAAPDGDFPNVPKHVANPENAVVFDAMIEYGRKTGV